MSTLQAILLGIMQGFTEFLPVSSSGHLVLLQHILQVEFDPTALQSFDIVLHAGTATAILWAYRIYWWNLLKGMWKLRSEEQKQVLLLIIATIPAGITGVLFGDLISANLRTLPSIAIAFFATAIFLLIASIIKKTSFMQPRLRHAIAMGLIQAVAIIPGISRSGSTIAAGLQTKLDQKAAVDFSFQMALPIIVGAFALTMKDVFTGEVILPNYTICMVGFASSFAVSLIALHTLRLFVRKFSIGWFSVYLLPLAAFTYLLS